MGVLIQMKANPKMPATTSAIAPMNIRPLIYEIRGWRVMLDRDLSALYGVLTKEGRLRFRSGTLAAGTIVNMTTLRFRIGTSKNVRGVKVEFGTRSNGECILPSEEMVKYGRCRARCAA